MAKKNPATQLENARQGNYIQLTSDLDHALDVAIASLKNPRENPSGTIPLNGFNCCPVCHHIIGQAAIFCKNCGQRINDTEIIYYT